MIFTPEQKMKMATDAAKQILDQLEAHIPAALVQMLEQIDEHVSAQIEAHAAQTATQDQLNTAITVAVSAQKKSFAEALRHIRRLASVGPARAGAVWGELDALLMKMGAS